MRKRSRVLGLALTLTLLGCVVTPPGSQVGPGMGGSGGATTGNNAGTAGSNFITARIKAPALALARTDAVTWLAQMLVPPAAEIPGFDTAVVASGSVVVSDAGSGAQIAAGWTDASGSLAISHVPADKLVKIEVTAPSGTTIAAVVRTPPEASGQTFDLGEVGTNNTVAADFFRSGDVDPALLELVDNRVVAFLADLIRIKLDEDFDSGAHSRDELTGGLKKHKKDEDKPRTEKGDPDDEDAADSQDPVRKLLSEMGLGEGDKTMLRIALDPALAPSLAELSPDERSDVMIRTVFLLQRQGEKETKKADEAESAAEGVPFDKPAAFRITAAQIQGLVKATKAYSAGDLLHAILQAKGVGTVTIGQTTLDLSAALLDPTKNSKALEAFKPWEKVKGVKVKFDTTVDLPVARLLLAFRAGKKSEDAFKEALKPYKDLIKADPALHLALRRKPLRVATQADLDALVAALSVGSPTPTPAPTATPAATASPMPSPAPSQGT